MAYVSFIVQGYVYVHVWGKTLDAQDAYDCLEYVQNARRITRRLLIGVFLMPADSPIPSREFIDACAAVIPDLMDQFSYGISIFQGSGIGVTLRRTALAVMLAVAGAEHTFVRRSVEDAFLLRPPYGRDPRARKIVDDLRRLKLT